MKNIYKLGLVLCAVAGASQSAVAAGDELSLDTWTVSNTDLVSFSGNQATLSSGSGSSTSTGAWGGTGGSTLSKNVSLGAGTTLTFQWDFQAGDYWPYNDFADVQIGSSVFNLSSVGAVGDYGTSGWQTFSYKTTTALNGPIEFIVSNGGDNSVSSSLTVSNLSAVPESTNIAMMLAGLGLLGTVVRRRQAR